MGFHLQGQAEVTVSRSMKFSIVRLHVCASLHVCYLVGSKPQANHKDYLVSPVTSSVPPAYGEELWVCPTVHLFIYTLNLNPECPSPLQVWLHAERHSGSEVQVERKQFGKEPSWVLIYLGAGCLVVWTLLAAASADSTRRVLRGVVICFSGTNSYHGGSSHLKSKMSNKGWDQFVELTPL